MIDGIPEVSDFDFTPDTPACPKCSGPMDRGQLEPSGASRLTYRPSVAPLGENARIGEALSCIACGYTELYTDPAELRCLLAGVEPPGVQSPG